MLSLNGRTALESRGAWLEPAGAERVLRTTRLAVLSIGKCRVYIQKDEKEQRTKSTLYLFTPLLATRRDYYVRGRVTKETASSGSFGLMGFVPNVNVKIFITLGIYT